MTHIKGLDSLRAFAVLCVIITHWGPHSFPSSPALTFVLQRIIPSGLFGVDLFFVLSGYLITRILLSARQSTEYQPKLLIIKNFYLRRSLRIFPIYYLFLLIMYLLGEPTIAKHFPYFATYTSNFLIIQTNNWSILGHTWSLSVEEQFYLIWPWIILYLPERYIGSCMIGFIIIEIVTSLVLEDIYPRNYLVFPLTCFGAFAIGGLYAYSQKLKTPWFKRVIFTLLPICLAIYLIYDPELGLTRLVNSVISVSLIIPVVEQKVPAFFNLILENKALNYIGKISYGIYLFHNPLPIYYNNAINFVSAELSLSPYLTEKLIYPPIGYILQLILLFILAHISFKYFERRFLHYKRFLPYESNNQKD